MPKRCSDTHFYVAGHKTRSGCAVYTTPDGAELEVVCGRNRPGPGQIHRRDVPDGVPLSVTGKVGTLELELDQDATRGRRGRMAFHRYIADASFDTHWTFAANCAAELLATSGEGRKWAQKVSAHAMYSSLRACELSHSELRHLSPDTWEEILAYRDPAGLRRYDRYVRRLVHSLTELDSSSLDHRHALGAAVALVGQCGAPPDALLRLNAQLARHAATAPGGAQMVRKLAALGAADVAVTGLARMLASSRGVPFASRSRALGLACYETLLNRPDDGLGRERWWPLVAILADEHASALHQAAARTVVWVDNFARGGLPACTYQLACPSAREAVLAEVQHTFRMERDKALTALTRIAPAAEAPGANLGLVETRQRLGSELEQLAAFFDVPDSLDPVARAQALAAGDLRRTFSLPERGSFARLLPSTELALECVRQGVTDPGAIEHLLMWRTPRGTVIGDPELGLSGTLALVQHGIGSVESRALLSIAGADSVPEMCELARRTPDLHDAALDAVYPDEASSRARAAQSEITAYEYAFFRGASISDPDEMVRRVEAGVHGLACIELTALGVVECGEQAAAIDTLPHAAVYGREQASFIEYIEAGFTAVTFREALAEMLDPWTVSLAHGAGFGPEEMLRLHRADRLDTALQFPQIGVRDPATIETLALADVTPELFVMYRGAGITDPGMMGAFRQAGIGTPDAVASHVAAAREQASRPQVLY